MGLVDSIIGNESGGNPLAQNPNSSAGGLGQFIDSTWLDMLQRHRPDLVQGKSREDLLALKSDPALSREMTDAYASDNQAILTKNGLPVTPGTTYLAHFAGPKGAVSVLNADPNAPVESILGASAVNANPFLKGMTAGDLRSWADKKMGGGGQPQTAQSQGNYGGINFPIFGSPLPQKIPPTQVASAQPLSSTSQASQHGIPTAIPSASFTAAPNLSALAPAQPQAAPSYFGQMPAVDAAIQAPPIISAPRRPIDLSRLQAALQASGNRGLFFSRG